MDAARVEIVCSPLHGDFVTDMWASAPSGPHVSGKVTASVTVEDPRPAAREGGRKEERGRVLVGPLFFGRWHLMPCFNPATDA